MNAQCSDKAREYFLKDYKKHVGSFMIEDFNLGRHKLIRGKINLWFVFKKEHFKSFKYQFPEFVEKFPEHANSEGDSINKKCLAQAVNFGCKYIVFAHKEDEYYFCKPKDLLLFCIENGLMRNQDKTNREKQKGGSWDDLNEDTYSFPLSYLNKWTWNEQLEIDE